MSKFKKCDDCQIALSSSEIQRLKLQVKLQKGYRKKILKLCRICLEYRVDTMRRNRQTNKALNEMINRNV